MKSARIIHFLLRQAAWSALLLGLLLTAGASYYAYVAFTAEIDARFEQHARRAGNAIQARMNTYVNTLIQTRGLFHAYPGLTRNDFRAYVDAIDVLHQYPGVQGIGFARRVPARALPGHEREVRASGLPRYRVWPDYARDDYFPIMYLEPFDWRNQRALGYDMATERVRREAMIRAARTGQPAMSGKVTLVQETEKDPQPGFLIYVPVYRNGVSLTTPEQRWDALLGFVYSPFRAQDLFNEALRWETEHVENVRLDIYDGPTLAPADLLYTVSSDPRGEARARSRLIRLNMGGREWTISATEERGFVTLQESAAPFFLFASGLLLSLMLFLIFRTEQHRLAAAEESRRKLAGVLESIHDSFASFDRNWNFTYINRAAARTVGRSPEELSGKNLFEEFPILRSTPLHASLALAMVEQKAVHLEEYAERLGAWFEIHAYPSKETLSVYFRDITERKRSEEAIRQAREHFRAAFTSTTVGMAVVLPDGRFLETNQAYRQITGYDESDLEHINFFGISHPDDRAPLAALTDRLIRGEIPSYNTTKRYQRKDGEIVWVESAVSIVRDKDGNPLNLIAISQDITQRRRAEESLAGERERLAVTLYSIADGVITTDVEGCVTLVNNAAQEMTGWTLAEAAGQPLDSVFQLFDARTQKRVTDVFSRLLGNGPMLPAGDCTLRHRDGSLRNVSLTASTIPRREGKILGMVLVFRDITEQAKTEQELIKARNLEALGVLAGGIAHDFNNILTAILGNLTLARLYSPSGGTASDILEEAEKASLRARELTQQLLTFAKGGMPIKKTASIADVVRETAVFALRGSSVRAELQISPELWPADFDASQMSQVISNLVVNAKQAMPNGGVVSISVDNQTLATGQVPGMPPGNYVRVRVEDHGVGIPPETIGRVFDPYFTTKPHGTGLGLATAYSIVKRHGGGISVESRVGKGTMFTVVLPATPHGKPEPAAAPAKVPVGSGSVLVMDDEEPVRRVAHRLLDRLGYKTTVAGDGNEAVRLYEAGLKTGENYDAVILDLTVPGGMGGVECLHRLRALDAGVRAIVSSGYSTDPIMSHYQEYGFQGRITKPYQVSELSEALRAALAEPASRGRRSNNLSK